MTVSIGKPIETAGRSIDEVNREVEAWIETEMRRIDPGAYDGPYVPEPLGSETRRVSKGR